MLSTVEEVLLKTEGLPEFPFTGGLEYVGIELTLEIHGQIVNGIPTKEVVANSVVFESLPSRVNVVGTNRCDTVFTKADGTPKNSWELLNRDNPATSIQELNSYIATVSETDLQNNGYFVLEYGGSKHIVKPSYQLAYKITPEEGTQSYECVGTTQYRVIPEGPKKTLTGEFKNSSETGSGNTIEFTPVSFFGLYKHDTTIELNPRSATITYDRYELLSVDPDYNNSGDQETVQYARCVLAIDETENAFQFIVMEDSRKYTFSIPLDSMGTLPSWVSERANTSHLLTAADTDETLLAEIDTDPASTTGNWISENGDAELLEVQ